MKAKLLHDQGGKTYILVFDQDDEFIATLLQFATQNGLAAAHFTAIGGFSDAILGYFEPEKKSYKKISLDEQVEVLALTGDITLKEDGTPQIHAHVVVGDSHGLAHGGHIMEAHVRPTLEFLLEESPAHWYRRHDPESGLALIAL
ncbi:PPC domain-containing DNA-binding protein [Ktedonobacter robiniae]|uniref:PPC domain-containing protein n=1 Tax=Ktedonobacter robiniae TaxID=2778365 RepID=A0ABQ3UUE4_9CHLR|nr:PPC domain-containing DNA-binding protein [Ktedonobacter robiniae]GHO56411.1 hypothetical protein KSB_48860 [Ktedonobacter robiniae]